jgi:hypothetical protein
LGAPLVALTSLPAAAGGDFGNESCKPFTTPQKSPDTPERPPNVSTPISNALFIEFAVYHSAHRDFVCLSAAATISANAPKPVIPTGAARLFLPRSLLRTSRAAK